MNIATVMYRNPLEQWFWESGLAYWFYGIVWGLVLLFFIAVWISTRNPKK